MSSTHSSPVLRSPRDIPWHTSTKSPSGSTYPQIQPGIFLVKLALPRYVNCLVQYISLCTWSQVPFEIDSLSILEALPLHIVVTSPQGDVLVLDNSLITTSSYTSSPESIRIATFLYARDICTFYIPSGVHEQGAILVNCLWAQQSVAFQIFSVSSHSGLLASLGQAILQTESQVYFPALSREPMLTKLVN